MCGLNFIANFWTLVYHESTTILCLLRLRREKSHDFQSCYEWVQIKCFQPLDIICFDYYPYDEQDETIRNSM